MRRRVRKQKGESYRPSGISITDTGILCRECGKYREFKGTNLGVTFELRSDGAFNRHWWCNYCGNLLRTDLISPVM